jgi:tetratricopeptide (TPR) repeat protein
LSRRGEFHHKTGQFQAALDDFTEAIDLGYDAFGLRGDVYFGLQQWDKALEDYTRAVKLDAGIADYWNSRGVCHFRLTRWQDAITDFSEAVRLDPKSWFYRRNRGNARAQSGDFANAAEDYEQAVQLGCQHPQSWMEHALIQHKVTGPDAYANACKEMFARFAESDDAAAASLALRCYVLLPGIAVGDDAISAFERNSSELEDRAEYWFTIGALRYRQERFSEAVASLEKAVDAAADGGEALPQLFLAMAHLRSGDVTRGKKWLDKAEVEVEGVFAEPLSGAAGRRPDWAVRLELTIVRQEARGLFGAATGDR